MKKQEFLDTLEQLLWDQKEEDRKEAIQYYIDYFEDAGISADQDVTEEFGSPEKVAARIKVELSDEHSEYSEQGFEDIRFGNYSKTMPVPLSEGENWEKIEEDVLTKEKNGKEKESANLWKIAVIVLAILTAPFTVPILGGMLAMILGVAVGGIALIAAIILAGISLTVGVGVGGLASGVILIINGFMRLLTVPSLAAMSLGVGALCISGGILGCMAFLWGVKKAIPWCVREIGEISRRAAQSSFWKGTISAVQGLLNNISCKGGKNS